MITTLYIIYKINTVLQTGWCPFTPRLLASESIVYTGKEFERYIISFLLRLTPTECCKSECYCHGSSKIGRTRLLLLRDTALTYR